MEFAITLSKILHSHKLPTMSRGFPGLLLSAPSKGWCPGVISIYLSYHMALTPSSFLWMCNCPVCPRSQLTVGKPLWFHNQICQAILTIKTTEGRALNPRSNQHAAQGQQKQKSHSSHSSGQNILLPRCHQKCRCAAVIHHFQESSC